VEEWALFPENAGEQIGIKKVFFKDNLAHLLGEQKSLAIQAIDVYIVDLANVKKIPNLLLAYITTLEQSVIKITDNPKYTCYKEVTECYNDLIEYLRAKAYSVGVLMNSKGHTPKKKSLLKWNDNINTLTTLFFDLYSKNLNNGKPYITYKSKHAVVDFIVDNFIDENDNELSPDTIKDYLKPGRISARANNDKAINISKILNNSKGH